MTSTDHPPDPPAEVCANCGALLVGEWCHGCGQRRRDSARLNLREVLGRFVEHCFDLDSVLLRTFAGLTVRPGELCRSYVEGRRKRYMNPFAYFLLAGAAFLLAEAATVGLFGDPTPEDGAAAGEYASWGLLALLVPLALVWRLLFRGAGRNLAEHYVFALYVLGQFVWIELLIFLPLEYLLPQPAYWAAFTLSWVSYLTFAAVPFYRESWIATAAKVLVSTFCLVVVVGTAGIVWFTIDPPPDPAPRNAPPRP